MANTVAVQLFDSLDYLDGRPLVLLTESDGRTTWFHGLAVGPVGMTYETALAEVDAAYFAARQGDPEDWGYDDVVADLARRGMAVLSHGVWDETRADAPLDDDEDE